MTELSILEKGHFLVSVQKDMSKVEITQMDTSNKLTEMLQVLADQSLSESERMAFFSEVAGYIQIASLFLAPLLVVGGILAAGGAFSALLGSIESSAQLIQGALVGTQGALEAASSEKRANIQKDKTATTSLQRSMDDALNCLENQKEMAQKYTEGALKILNNDARISHQKTVQ